MKIFEICYRLLKFYVRHGLVTDKSLEIFSFRRSKWLAKYTSFETQKRNQAVHVFEKDLQKLLKKAFYGKAMKMLQSD